jgi:hypothetical protein
MNRANLDCANLRPGGRARRDLLFDRAGAVRDGATTITAIVLSLMFIDVCGHAGATSLSLQRNSPGAL